MQKMTTPTHIRSPLRLPNGSIRALLTLLIVAVVISQMIRGNDIEVLWTETLLIALAHYFTSRRFIKLPPEAIDRLVAEGFIEAEHNPLFLPKCSIRVILICAFAGVAVFLYLQHRLFETPALSLLGVVFAYLLGVVARLKQFRGWENVKATAVLLVLTCTAIAYLMNRSELVPHLWRNFTLGLVLFYFGSR
jgi:hypothetical protein